MTFFSGEISIFLVIDLVFRIFPLFSQIFRIFTMLNVVGYIYDPFLTRKTPFFTRFILSRASDNTSSQNIGGYGCMGRPPPQIFWGTVTPVPPMSPPLGVAVYLGWCSAMHNTSMLKSPAQEQLLCIRN